MKKSVCDLVKLGKIRRSFIHVMSNHNMALN